MLDMKKQLCISALHRSLSNNTKAANACTVTSESKEDDNIKTKNILNLDNDENENSNQNNILNNSQNVAVNIDEVSKNGISLADIVAFETRIINKNESLFELSEAIKRQNLIFHMGLDIDNNLKSTDNDVSLREDIKNNISDSKKLDIGNENKIIDEKSSDVLFGVGSVPTKDQNIVMTVRDESTLTATDSAVIDMTNDAVTTNEKDEKDQENQVDKIDVIEKIEKMEKVDQIEVKEDISDLENTTGNKSIQNKEKKEKKENDGEKELLELLNCFPFDDTFSHKKKDLSVLQHLVLGLPNASSALLLRENEQGGGVDVSPRFNAPQVTFNHINFCSSLC